MKTHMIFSLDIGSSKVVSIAGSIGESIEINGVSTNYFINSNKNNDLLSVTNGVVCNLESVGTKVSQTLNEARINADCSYGGVLLNIAGNHVCNYYTKSKIDLNNQVITGDMLRQLITDATAVKIPTQYEVLDYEVQEYVLDGENYANNPIHLMANTIELNVNLLLAGATQVANLKKIIQFGGFNLAKLIPSGILSGMAVLNHEEKELGCCLIDIGAGTTDVVVYESGFIRYMCSIPVGGENITRDISNVLKISRNLAEDVKLNYGGISDISTYSLGEGVVITDHRGINTSISRKLLFDVITARVNDIFEVVKSTLKKQKIYDIISSGIVLTGGTALLPNLEYCAVQHFNMPVRIGAPDYVGDFAEIVTNPKYATSMGALYFAKNYMLAEIEGQYASHSSILGIIKKLFVR